MPKKSTKHKQNGSEISSEKEEDISNKEAEEKEENEEESSSDSVLKINGISLFFDKIVQYFSNHITPNFRRENSVSFAEQERRLFSKSKTCMDKLIKDSQISEFIAAKKISVEDVIEDYLMNLIDLNEYLNDH